MIDPPIHSSFKTVGRKANGFGSLDIVKTKTASDADIVVASSQLNRTATLEPFPVTLLAIAQARTTAFVGATGSNFLEVQQTTRLMALQAPIEHQTLSG